jgi:UDP-N-acetylglucosamine acyltransferase
MFITEPDWKGYIRNDGLCEMDRKPIIGKNTQIREGVIINKSTKCSGTVIGENCYLMNRCFVGHDSKLGNDVTLGPGCSIAGFVTIGDHSVIGMNASVHQNSKLGKCCMIGANTFFKGESPNGITWGGVPGKPIKVNEVGIQRSSLDEEEKLQMIEDAKLFIYFFQSTSNV